MPTTWLGKILAGLMVFCIAGIAVTSLYGVYLAFTSMPPPATPPAVAAVDDPASAVTALVTALDASDVAGVLATLAPELPASLDRATALVTTWQQAGQEPRADTAAQLGPRLQLDLGAPTQQDAIAVSTVTARHSAGTLVLTVMQRRTSEGWRVSDWQLQTRDLRLPTPTAAGLR